MSMRVFFLTTLCVCLIMRLYNMNKRTVFLAGPMRGLERAVSLSWRQNAARQLASKFRTLHAMRAREHKETFSDYRAAVIRDLNDIECSDIVLVNDSFPNVSMIGTAMEVFFAHQHNKPVIIFGSAHEKDYWLNYHSHMRVADLKEACTVLKKFFA
jgi:nucleoside 2-deoxyribosyltransferase